MTMTMTMTIDASQQQRFGSLPFHDMAYSSHPHFTNPWAPAPSTAPQSTSQAQALFAASPAAHPLPHVHLDSLKHAPPGTTSRPSTTPHPAVPVTAAAAAAGSPPPPPLADVYGRPDLLAAPPDHHLLGLGDRMPLPAASSAAAYDNAAVYSTAGASPVSAAYAPPPPYDHMGYAPAPLRAPAPAFALHPDAADGRRYSAQSVASTMSSLSSASSLHSLDAVPSPHPRILSDHLHLHSSLPSQHQQQQQQHHHHHHHHHHHQHQHHQHHPHDDRKSFQDALEASHGMLSMSQETPRNIYDVRRGQRVVAARASPPGASPDGYGFPAAPPPPPPPPHSASSSLSSSTDFGGYYVAGGGSGSVDGSVSDYSTGGSDIESLSGRLPRPGGGGGGGGGNGNGMLVGGGGGSGAAHHPPSPQSMMGSFNSKVQSGTQKKHKCKVCDKRFTRPSSLQTHMYSHTGEKPFSCKVEGCGRHFSVVSNLRRHRKVHKGQAASQAETPSDAGSEDHQSE